MKHNWKEKNFHIVEFFRRTPDITIHIINKCTIYIKNYKRLV